MDYLEFLFAGFAVFWAGLFAYLLWLQARLQAVSNELERLEERLAERAGDADGEPRGAPTAPSPAGAYDAAQDR